MKRRYKIVPAALAVVILLILMFLWLTGNLSREGKISPGKSEAPERSARGLKTMIVEATSIPLTIEAVGAVDARSKADISGRMLARIVEITADAGDAVSKGQTLVVLDSRDAMARLEQAREALASAQAALEKTALDAGRIERLYEKKAATKQEYDRSRAALKMARASVDSAAAAVRESEVALSYYEIVSPIDGKLVDRLVEPGDMALPGKPLMSVYNPSTLRLEVAVAERMRPSVRLGDGVRASIDSIEREIEGKIEEIVPASDSASRSFAVRVAIPTAEDIYPGMYGRIRIDLGSTETVLVPPEAIKRVGQLEMVTVVEDAMVRTRAIKTGKTYADGVEVLAGLRPGETIVLP